MTSIVSKVFRRILRIVFGFESWHTYILADRKYALEIIKYCNELPRKGSVVEIGCGLGDIIRNLRFAKKLGCDIDTRVLKGARTLAIFKRPKIMFRQFTFPTSRLEGSFDLIITVNWVCEIEQHTLKLSLEDYFANRLNKGGTMIIDTVQDPHYTHNHNIKFLVADIPGTLKKIGDFERQREVWSITKAE